MVGSSSEFEADRQRLAELLAETGALRYSPDKPFKLASGAESELYFDLRLLNGDPEGINAVAGAFYRRIREIPDVRAVGGLESGSIPIATAVSQLSYLEHQRDPSNPLITSFYVRKAPKTHGTQKAIEGRIASPVVIIDDVITSGTSAMAAVRQVREEGFECGSLMSLMFRGTEEHRRNIERECRLEYIFHKDEFVEQFKELATSGYKNTPCDEDEAANNAILDAHESDEDMECSDDGVDLPHFNKYRALMIKNIAKMIVASKDKRHASIIAGMDRKGKWAVHKIEKEFDAPIHVILQMASTIHPPNKISMIVEFESVRSLINKVPTKEEFEKHSPLHVSEYDHEFKSWGHFLERLGYDPWYRDTVRSPELISYSNQEEPYDDMVSDSARPAEGHESVREIIRNSLTNNPDMLKLFAKVDQNITKLDPNNIKEMLEDLKHV